MYFSFCSANNISKINQLNQELKTYGSSAQMIAGNYGNTFGSYLSEVSELGTLFNESIDTYLKDFSVLVYSI